MQTIFPVKLEVMTSVTRHVNNPLSNKSEMWLMRQRNHNETKNAWTCEKWSAFQTHAVYDKQVKEVHDWIKVITINWPIPIWEQSISQVTNQSVHENPKYFKNRI